MEALVIFQRRGGEKDDFAVSIVYEDGLYYVTVNEKDRRDPQYYEHTFNHFRHVRTYIAVLMNQVLNDVDPENKFLYVQYTIPYFPTVIMPVKRLKNALYYRRFRQALSFFFRQPAE
jgi:hypothetical protein